MGYKFALVGKSIDHSYSPLLFQQMLGDKLINYDLLDRDNFFSVGELKKILLEYKGLNVTAPFKSRAFQCCDHTDGVAHSLQLVNSLKLHNQKIIGTLTDAVAAKKILQHLLAQYPSLPICILGDGAMSKMIQLLLQQNEREFTVCSRRVGWKDAFTQQSLLINCCWRDAIFPATPYRGSAIWDLNYAYNSLLDVPGVDYFNGEEMLKLQAEAALDFFMLD